MSCLYPLKLYQQLDPETGEFSPPRSYSGYIDDFDDWKKDDPFIFKFVVACGSCKGCRVDRAHAWSDRLVMESLYQGQDRSWFVTLTYRDEDLPGKHIPILDRETYHIQNTGVLNLDHVSEFIKRLRSRLDQPGIRFFAAGEYGGCDGLHGGIRRPHYHVILFADLPDVRSTKSVDGDKILYLPRGSLFSPIIEECWGKGLTSVSPANAYTMSYVAGYVQKKLGGSEEKTYLQFLRMLQRDGVVVDVQPKESARMSRKPGIGMTWLEANADRIASGSVAIPTPDGARSAPLPRVAERVLNEKLLTNIKNTRKARSLAARARKRQQLAGVRSLDAQIRLEDQIRQKKSKF